VEVAEATQKATEITVTLEAWAQVIKIKMVEDLVAVADLTTVNNMAQVAAEAEH
jgi:hypothetical protein